MDIIDVAYKADLQSFHAVAYHFSVHAYASSLVEGLAKAVEDPNANPSTVREIHARRVQLHRYLKDISTETGCSLSDVEAYLKACIGRKRCEQYADGTPLAKFFRLLESRTTQNLGRMDSQQEEKDRFAEGYTRG